MLEVPPSMNPTAASRFAEHLRTHQSTITEAWVKAVKSDREIASSQEKRSGNRQFTKTHAVRISGPSSGPV